MSLCAKKEPFIIILIMFSSLSANSSGSLRYGDIELFLMGLQLGHLVSLFKVRFL